MRFCLFFHGRRVRYGMKICEIAFVTNIKNGLMRCIIHSCVEWRSMYCVPTRNARAIIKNAIVASQNTNGKQQEKKCCPKCHLQYFYCEPQHKRQHREKSSKNYQSTRDFFFANAAAAKTTKNVYFFFVKIISENLWSIDAYAYFIVAHYDICFVRDRTRVHATRTRTIWCRLSSTHAEQRLLWLTFDERGMEIPQLVLLVGRVTRVEFGLCAQSSRPRERIYGNWTHISVTTSQRSPLCARQTMTGACGQSNALTIE